MNKPKFNLLDGFIIIVLVLALAAGAYFLVTHTDLFGLDEDEERETTATFQVELTSVEKIVADEFEAALKRKKPVVVGEAETFDGMIRDVKVNPAKKTIINEETGQLVLADDPRTFDVLITLSADVTETSYEIKGEKRPLKVGEGINIKTPEASGYGYIVDLKLKD